MAFKTHKQKRQQAISSVMTLDQSVKMVKYKTRRMVGTERLDTDYLSTVSVLLFGKEVPCVK